MKTKYFLLAALALTGCATQSRNTFHWDNDILKINKTQDKNFTNGLRFTTESPDETGSTAFFVGQNIYTPNHGSKVELQPDDRPYAGYLYTGADFKYRVSSDEQNTLGLTAGIVGPHSYAEQTQNTFHRTIHQHTFKGWDNQLSDELGLILKAEKTVGGSFTENSDVYGTLGANLGNVFTQGYTGASFRYGRNLPDYFLAPDIVFPRAPRTAAVNDHWAYYFFGGPWLRAVAHNIFLDGNTFRDSHSVSKYPFVLEGRLGFAIEKGYRRFAYTYVKQTKEFHEETDDHSFGEINFSWGW